MEQQTDGMGTLECWSWHAMRNLGDDTNANALCQQLELAVAHEQSLEPEQDALLSIGHSTNHGIPASFLQLSWAGLRSGPVFSPFVSVWSTPWNVFYNSNVNTQ